VKVTRIAAGELDPELIGRWERLHQSHAELASPYFSPHFTRLVAETRGDVYVGVLEEGGAPVGFFPFHRGSMGRGRPIGLGLSDHHGVVIAPGTPFVATDLLRGCGLTCYSFDHLSASQGPFEAYVERRDVSPILDLSCGYEAFAAAVRRRGSKQIVKNGTLRRKLEREVGPLRFTAQTRESAPLAAILGWKSTMYDQSKTMFDQPWIQDLLRRLCATDLPGFGGMLSGLWVGERLVAAHMGMRSHRVWHYWFPAYDESLARYSPGLILLLDMATAAPGLGLSHVDLGKGASQYKERLMTGQIPLSEGRVDVPGLVTTVRRTGRRLGGWVRRSPLAPLVRLLGRAKRRKKFT
jgi:CelD/BcsL family acetyltransferase involved in cellulose biosynthesis